MVITAIQAILIAFAVGLIVGGVIGWKLTFNMRMAKIQELQVINNKLRDQNNKLRAKVRSHNLSKTKENVGKKVVAAGDAAVAAGGAAATVVSGLRERLLGKNKNGSDQRKLKESE